MKYFDNGATSFPKAPGVANAMVDYIENVGVNIGRGSYSEAFSAGGIVIDCRDKILKLFNAPSNYETVFTKNITESINIVLKGYLKSGDHVVTTSVEHNAIMRPLKSLERFGITHSKAEVDEFGMVKLASIESLICDNTKAIIVTHASNVCGTINDIEGIGLIAQKYNIPLILDVAQTAGIVEIDIKKNGAKVVCYTGHKGLLGPQGVGGFVIEKEFASLVDSFIDGGTGSSSDSEIQPDMLPDKFESGTQNLPGIFGLNAAMDYILEIGIDKIHNREMELTRKFIEGVSQFKNIRIIGKMDTVGRTAVVSIDFIGRDNAEIAYLLDKEYDIKTRVGMHCAPSAHKALGTFPQGTVRFSFSYFNSDEELELLIEALKSILNE